MRQIFLNACCKLANIRHEDIARPRIGSMDVWRACKQRPPGRSRALALRPNQAPGLLASNASQSHRKPMGIFTAHPFLSSVYSAETQQCKRKCRSVTRGVAQIDIEPDPCRSDGRWNCHRSSRSEHCWRAERSSGNFSTRDERYSSTLVNAWEVSLV